MIDVPGVYQAHGEHTELFCAYGDTATEVVEKVALLVADIEADFPDVFFDIQMNWDDGEHGANVFVHGCRKDNSKHPLKWFTKFD